ncbi:hypothetical protein Talka_01272 [Tepidimonas alkaliphilus]|uniref:Uncharacterized protein n=1 Tax=Tepidimonas alkaliphilus TaxID=2588942 RepID=A0A554W8N4_9BURK|nr:DUF5368 family protein [Tepidimonas alkaliphilus]TSE19923.1 hypothetical protein Talka_01272 [Tepidimonas alkaliphilus]
MKDYDPMVFLAVFQEMLGPLLWILPLLALAAVAGFVWVWRREGGLVSRRLVRAELLGLLGGGLALVIMAAVSSSGFTDAAGPADWFLIMIVYGVGFVATTVLAYTVLGLLWPRQPTAKPAT